MEDFRILTVIIPVAPQHSKLVHQAVDSVRKQTYVEAVKEVMVVNDTGKELEIPGVTMMSTRGREGASICRNIALDKVHTNFVMFLDADDLLINTAVETTLKAFASYDEASYIYGDAWTIGDDGGYLYYASPLYNRQYLIGERNIHNITTLLPTYMARAIGGFDEVARWWEDWDFYIRLGIAGYCGAKVPSPLILYRLNTGINRQNHGKIGNELVREVRERYGDYIEGRKLLMGCCGSDAELKKMTQRFLDSMPPGQTGIGDVLLEYLGANEGSIPFRVNGNVYRAANNKMERFIHVKREDVAFLLNTKVFRMVPESIGQAQRPDAIDEVIQARKATAPPGVTIARMDKASDLASSVTQVFGITCKECGHIKNFDSPKGCQALMPNGQICGCPKFVEAKKRGRPAGTRKGKTPRNSGTVPQAVDSGAVAA